MTSERGVITKEIQEVSKEHIGREITQKELRLIAYVQYRSMNEHNLDIAHINQEERKILSKWKEEKFLEGGASGLLITKKFWDFMCAILFIGYVRQAGGELR